MDGDEQETHIASIELDPDDGKMSDEVCKQVELLCKDIQSKIKGIKCEFDYNKYEGSIYVSLK